MTAALYLFQDHKLTPVSRVTLFGEEYVVEETVAQFTVWRPNRNVTIWLNDIWGGLQIYANEKEEFIEIVGYSSQGIVLSGGLTLAGPLTPQLVAWLCDLTVEATRYEFGKAAIEAVDSLVAKFLPHHAR